MELNIQASSGNKKRLLVGLAWDDTPVSQPSRRKNIILNIFGTLLHSLMYALRSSKVDKNEDKPGRDINFSQRDLDLLCFIFNQEKKLVCTIGPDEDQMIEETNSVYHSGEEYTGSGVYDDEIIRIEIAKLPEHYHHFVFVVVSDSKLSLSECGPIRLRLADSSTDKNFIAERLEAPNNGSSAYIFSRLTRKGDGWDGEAVGRYTDFEGDWSKTLPALL